MRKIFMVMSGLLFIPSLAFAVFPLRTNLLNNVAVASTATVCAEFQIDQDMPSLDGDFAFQLSATSVTGTADIRLTVQPYVDVLADFGPFYDLSGVDHAVLIASTLTTFSADGSWYIFDNSRSVVPFAPKVRFCVTGINANPADTKVTFTLIRK